MLGSFSPTFFLQPDSIVDPTSKTPHVSLYEDFSIVPLSLLRNQWPLRTLHLELVPDHPHNDVTTVPLTMRILGLGAMFYNSAECQS